MWSQFDNLGPIEEFVIDNTTIDPLATAMLVRQRLAAGDLGFPEVDL